MEIQQCAFTHTLHKTCTIAGQQNSPAETSLYYFYSCVHVCMCVCFSLGADLSTLQRKMNDDKTRIQYPFEFIYLVERHHWGCVHWKCEKEEESRRSDEDEMQCQYISPLNCMLLSHKRMRIGSLHRFKRRSHHEVTFYSHVIHKIIVKLRQQHQWQ